APRPVYWTRAQARRGWSSAAARPNIGTCITTQQYVVGTRDSRAGSWLSGVMTLAVRAVSATDQALVRSNNEDAVLVGSRLLAVADGMGGFPPGRGAGD